MKQINTAMVREEKKICFPGELTTLCPELKRNIENLFRGEKEIELSFELISRFFSGSPEKITQGEINNHLDYLDNFSNDIVFFDSGVFLCSSNVDFNAKYFNNLISEYGVWKAQGINNHIHLCCYSDDKIVQRMIGYSIIVRFLNLFFKLKIKNDIVFYLNGDADLSLCVYSLTNVDNCFLENFDRYLAIEDCRVTLVPLS